MDLSIKYLRLQLKHPLMPGASPLAQRMDSVRRLEDAGAAAIVMPSLFEEQIAREQLAALHHLDRHGESSAEATTYFPSSDAFALTCDAYLEQLRRIRAAVEVPVIASLNGTTPGGWLEYAALIEQAGAHALELNLYFVATDPLEDATTVEARALDVVRVVRQAVKIPLAVKLSPFYSSLPHFVRQLDELGVDGVVLFNRFYQPDIDTEQLELSPVLHLSDPAELLLRLRWLAVLSGHTTLSLAASGGVFNAIDAVKAVMSGAHAVQMVSALLRQGPEHLSEVLEGLETWLDEHEYESVQQLCGSMNLARCPNPAALERGNYMSILRSWHPEDYDGLVLSDSPY